MYKIHTDLGKPEETTANIPVENKLAVIEVYKFKCGLYTYWQEMARKLPKLEKLCKYFNINVKVSSIKYVYIIV